MNRKFAESKDCYMCKHVGRSGGVSSTFRWACFNKKSKYYMQSFPSYHQICAWFESNPKRLEVRSW